MVRESASAGRTIISPVVARDRIISKFPKAFNVDATPYKKFDFHPRVRQACSANKTGTVGLKICKGVMVGDVAVGKSCLVNRFCRDVFDRDYKATIGVDFEVEKFSILTIPFNLQLWDTAGQERFKCIAASYYRGANVVIVVFDLSEIESLANTRTWKEDACTNACDPLVFLVGTKKDLVSHMEIDVSDVSKQVKSASSDATYKEVEEEAIALANAMGAEFWAVSSKTGENVQEFFFRVVSLTFDNAVLKEFESSTTNQQIGSNLIKVDKTQADLYEKNQKKLKCCN